MRAPSTYAMDLVSRLDTLDRLIKAGSLDPARREILAMAKRKVPRKQAVAVARLALRVGLFDVGLGLLHPHVRSAPRRPARPTADEKAEYAHLLVKSGAIAEGRALLAEARDATGNRALLYDAVAHIAEWNYRDAITALSSYLDAGPASDYDGTVAKINLAAAYVHEGELNRVEPLLSELLHHCSLRGYHFALARALEISAESLMARKRWDRADAFLDEAAKRLGTGFSAESLYVKKFKALTRLFASRGDAASRALTRALRAEAESAGSFETVRDCDRAIALVDEDLALLARLWFGTPYASYREKIARDLASLGAEIPAYFDWTGGAGRSRRLLNLLDGTWAGKPTELVPGAVPHRLLVALARDFYRPQPLAALHGTLHPDRHYHPRRSAALVHDACYRLRGALDRAGAPIRIAQANGFSRLVLGPGMGLRLWASYPAGSRFGEILERLRGQGDGPFSLSQAVIATGRPRRTVFRALQEGCAQGLLERAGKARSTRYRFGKRGG